MTDLRDLPPHLRPERSDRGFLHYPALPSRYGGEVRAYESSSAETPCVWVKATCPVDLNDRDGPSREAYAHLTVADAWRLGEQLLALVAGHYWGDGRPPMAARVADVTRYATRR